MRLVPFSRRALRPAGRLARTLPWIALLAAVDAQAAESGVLVITQDATLDARSLAGRHVVVRGSHLTIDGAGAVLQGPGRIGDEPSLGAAGIGVLLEGCDDVRVQNLKVSGFATGLLARDCRGLRIEGCDFSDNYHNPRHGWGELPPRGGVRLERTRESVLLRNKANRVWNALELADSDDIEVTDNDFSHCSNTCAKLWHSSRNRFVGNNLSYGIRIDRAAGEVHARDSASVLIETGSDDNYWRGNNITQGGDGIFIRVLNGWVSRGNLFIENDASYANNNCVESWSPGNTYIRNKANHGSYGFWLGGGDQTVLIGNEAGFNGLTNGNHNAPEPGFAHGGIVLVGGSSSHTLLDGNWCHDNNGAGIVFRGDAASKGARWRTEHWVLQRNRLENNRWGVWGRWGRDLWIGANLERGNRQPDFLSDVDRLLRPGRAAVASDAAPHAELQGPARAVAGRRLRFDAAGSRDGAGRPLSVYWSAGHLSGKGAVFEPVFDKPGFYRVALTVDNGALADLAWRDVLVTAAASGELGTEAAAGMWGFDLEGNDDRRGRMQFADDPDAVVGQTSLRFTPNPYPGLYATAVFPADRHADFDFSTKSVVQFWLKTRNPNLPGFQNAGPVLWLHTPDGKAKFEPAKGGNLCADPTFSEARWSWMLVEIPLAGDAAWSRTDSGKVDLAHVRAIGISLDSWGNAPFTVWLDGLTAQ